MKLNVSICTTFSADWDIRALVDLIFFVQQANEIGTDKGSPYPWLIPLGGLNLGYTHFRRNSNNEFAAKRGEPPFLV